MLINVVFVCCGLDETLADMLIWNLHPQRSAERAVSGVRASALVNAKNTKFF